MTLSTSQTRIIHIFNNFCHGRNEPQPCPSRGENSSIHSILYIPIVPFQSFCILHHYQSSINRFKIHTMLFPLLIIVTFLIVQTVSFPTVWWTAVCLLLLLENNLERQHETLSLENQNPCDLCTRSISIHHPRVAGADQETLLLWAPPSFISDMDNKPKPPHTLRGGFTTNCQHTWDHEVQSENRPNPQLEEINKERKQNKNKAQVMNGVGVWASMARQDWIFTPKTSIQCDTRL